MPKPRYEFDDHLFDLTREPDTEVRAKMPGHRFEIDAAFFELGREIVADVRSALIDEAWFGRPAHSVRDGDQSSLGWSLPEGRTASEQSHDPFSDRWSPRDDARLRDAPEADHELDFDR